MRKTRLAIVSSMMLLAVLGAVGTVAAAAPGKGSTELRRAVTSEGIMQHEREFQRIAAANGNSPGPPGRKATTTRRGTWPRSSGPPATR